MPIKTLCVALLPTAAAEAPAALSALSEAASTLVRATPGLRQALLHRVVQHIPTDYMANDRAYNGVTAEADQVDVAIALEFADAEGAAQALAGPAWAAFGEAVGRVARPLFTLDAEPNVPVALQGGAPDGGFRRWLLLTRKAETAAQFRDGWFGRHASLVRHLPQLDGYVQNLVTARYDAAGRPVAYEAMPIDGIAEVCFADRAAMDASYASDARLPLRDDGRDLMGRVSTMLVQGTACR